MMQAIGLMSGTSMDGIDVALLRTDGEKVERTGKFLSIPYMSETRQMLREVIAEVAALPAELAAQKPLMASVLEAEQRVTALHIQAVEQFMRENHLVPSDVDVIGFHGHTIAHNPALGMTWQIGDGPLMAKVLGIPTVYDFRSADVRAGGQGAPLVPLYHAALMQHQPKPLCVVNIGGVANITYIPADMSQMLACDVGPGNAYLDDWVFKHTGQPYDNNGEVSARGQLDYGLVHHWLAQPFFAQFAPKSLDRNDFILPGLDGLSVEDGAATLAYFTAAAIAKSAEILPQAPVLWAIAGGGRHNPTIMNYLNQLLNNRVQPVDKIESIDGDALEAEAFAYLAVRTLKGLPISLPGTTGVSSSSVTGGVVCLA